MIIPANGNGNQTTTLVYDTSDMQIVHKNAWISVKDHLPDRCKDVLFQGINGGMHIGQYQGDNTDGSICFREWNEGTKEYMAVLCVAWQPLPTPYEGD